jgi:DNA-binding transcriptional MerR regulator
VSTALPPIPPKRYFTIGEVGELCAVKPHVLRYWEQEFTQLRPMKRRGNRRYYQHHEVLMIRRIRDLLYEQGFTISGARNKLADVAREVAEQAAAVVGAPDSVLPDDDAALEAAIEFLNPAARSGAVAMAETVGAAHHAAVRAADPFVPALGNAEVRRELLRIRELLALDT